MPDNYTRMLVPLLVAAAYNTGPVDYTTAPASFLNFVDANLACLGASTGVKDSAGLPSVPGCDAAVQQAYAAAPTVGVNGLLIVQNELNWAGVISLPTGAGSSSKALSVPAVPLDPRIGQFYNIDVYVGLVLMDEALGLPYNTTVVVPSIDVYPPVKFVSSVMLQVPPF